MALARHPLRQQVDADLLLSAGVEGVQLTWMDAKVGDWIVTPRQGRPVEINALWYNALRIMEHLARHFGEQEKARQFQLQAERAAHSFEQLFWNEEKTCLYDVVDDQQRDASIRPNQIFALSLPFPLLFGERARQVFEAVDHHLFTPRGLRSLAPEDPAYRSHYGGSPHERDGAYHQGTVWGWLLGPFITALVRLYGEEGRTRSPKNRRGPGAAPGRSRPGHPCRTLRGRAALCAARLHSPGLERGRGAAGLLGGCAGRGAQR